MLSRAVFHSERALYSSLQKGNSHFIGKRLFAKSRIVLDRSPILPAQPVVELSPFNKIREIAKKSHLPLAHVTKALCTREGKNFILKVIYIYWLLSSRIKMALRTIFERKEM